MRRIPRLSLLVFVLSVVAIVVSGLPSGTSRILSGQRILDWVLIVGVVAEIVAGTRRVVADRRHAQAFMWGLVLQVGYVWMVVSRTLGFAGAGTGSGAEYLLLIGRVVLMLIPSLTSRRRLSGFVSDIVSRPAQTVALSFALVIVLGTWLLMLPFTAADGSGLGFGDALFTTTSAVCVTGLIVVDTATVYTVWGHLVLVALIQIGGLGIMVLALFTLTIRRQAVTIESKMLLSYMISETRMSELSKALKRIVLITFGVELAGAAFLFAFLGPVAETTGRRFLLAGFHSVSAFCNAGFALFSDSLERFRDHVGINVIVVILIVTGGLSFGVLTNVFQHLRDLVRRQRRNGQSSVAPLSVNTRTVLTGTAVLLIGSFFLFYAIEHGRSLSEVPTGRQYLAALFQAVTLRTAGFNTVPFDRLSTATYVMMTSFMFVGGASGSTAGGIKINNMAAIVAYLRTARNGAGQTVIFGHAISDRQTATAFSVLLMGGVSIGLATFLLSLSESAHLHQIVFEAVSAFGTVGLSTGITPELTTFGKMVITILMFIGRVGPLTLLAATARTTRASRATYPSADLAIG